MRKCNYNNFMSFKYLIFLLYVLVECLICAQAPHEINIGLAFTPGLLQKDGKGALDLALHDIEQGSNIFHFNIVYMSYLRAKIELEKGHVDIIGLTPKGYESEDFYRYAQELDWSLDTDLVLFCNSRSELELTHGERVGTPPGNEGFVAEIMKMKESRFESGNLVSLVKRLKKHRIPCIVFEEYSTLKMAKVHNLHWHNQCLSSMPMIEIVILGNYCETNLNLKKIY